ncbi:uncharacterized protein J4E92_007254 [Alternaria infectoria]|uniref:uncharacterized protein n=1 Tax=Alternaria infectoria TaxID=45303 RepID=UPI00221E7CF0|nr:uncharacterized protein J4E92_007254 [Alternaria infectoria]KAI4924173.1 hypothetical protein J4E92_007254 [Alternaria infectoria]
MTALPQYEPSRQLPQDVQNNERYTSPSSSPDENGKRPLDLVQRLEKKLAEYNASQNVFKRWLFELASWLISALCMGAVIGIYITISGQEMAKSEQYLTISNTLGKIASATLIVPTSEALGQLKWNWFHKSNAMWDFEIFDKASRGAWGATLLLFRTKGRSLAALGKLWSYELHIMNTWDDFFPSFYTAAGEDSEPILRFRNYPDGPSTRFIDFNPWLAPNNVTRHMEGLASALTNVMRSNSKSNEALLGEAYNLEKFVHINWPWLIFPLLLLLLSLVFLVATIIKTSNDTDTGFWKTSAMPTLMYGLPQDMRKDSISTTSSDGASHHDPRKVRIRLLPKQGWRVSGQVHPAPTAPPGFI